MIPGADRTGFFPELHALRGLLALWVYAYHAVGLGWGKIEHFPGFWPRISSGAYAVDVFILLSGFVIAGLVNGRAESYGRYLWRRACRLYPVYLLGLLLALGGISSGWIARPETGAVGEHFAAHLTLLHGLVPDAWLPDAPVTLIGAAWSLSLEWQFYLLAPFAVRFAGRSPLRLLLLGLICLLAQRLTWPRWAEAGFEFPSLLPTRAGYFYLGIVSWMIVDRAWRSPGLAERSLLLLAAAPLLLFVRVEYSVPLLLWAAALALILPGEPQAMPLVAALRSLSRRPVAQHLGSWSYAVYLLHALVLHPLANAFTSLPAGPLRALMLGLAGLPLTLGLAALVHRWVELPAIHCGRAKPQPPASASVPIP